MFFRHKSRSVAVVSSCNFGQRLAPGHWWQDRLTMETVWLEFGKILYMHILPLRMVADFILGDRGLIAVEADVAKGSASA